MAKSRKRKKTNITTKNTPRKKRSATTTRVTRSDELSIKDEIKYIIKCAINYETKIVSVKELILFCTETGDAWLLGTDDYLALNLAKEGVKQEFSLIDTPHQFGIDWKYNYLIDNEKFIFADKTGISRTIIGYPTDQILEMINKRKYLNSQN